jgi:large subunit ribosomal protein L19
MELIKEVEKEYITDNSDIDFKSGDTVTVAYRIQEGTKSRVQKYTGVVIQRKGSGMGATFTVRKASANSVNVERVFPLHSPLLESVEVESRGKVRRARIYFMRERTGKSARLKEIRK